MKSRFLKAALAVVSACTLMACSPEKAPSTSSGTLSTTKQATENHSGPSGRVALEKCMEALGADLTLNRLLSGEKCN